MNTNGQSLPGYCGLRS